MFRVAPPLELKKLEERFRHKVLQMLIAKGKVTREMLTLLSGWRYSGFHVFSGNSSCQKRKRRWESRLLPPLGILSTGGMRCVAEEESLVKETKDGNDRIIDYHLQESMFLRIAGLSLTGSTFTGDSHHEAGQ